MTCTCSCNGSTPSILQKCVLMFSTSSLDLAKCNFVPVMFNDSLFTFLLAFLLYFNSESRWNSNAAQSVVWMFCCINMVIFLIVGVDTVKGIIKAIRIRRNRNRIRSAPVENTTVNENTQRQIEGGTEEQIYTGNTQFSSNQIASTKNEKKNNREEEKNCDNFTRQIIFKTNAIVIAPMVSSSFKVTETQIPYDEIS